MFSTGLPQPNNPPNFLARARRAAAFLRARLAFEPSLAMAAMLIAGVFFAFVAWGATLAAASSMVRGGAGTPARLHPVRLDLWPLCQRGRPGAASRTSVTLQSAGLRPRGAPEGQRCERRCCETSGARGGAEGLARPGSSTREAGGAGRSGQPPMGPPAARSTQTGTGRGRAVPGPGRGPETRSRVPCRTNSKAVA